MRAPSNGGGRIDAWFLVLAATCLIGGTGLGIGMGIAHDFELVPVHAHVNLLGWASLALFGLVYRVYPDLVRSRLALVHFGLAAPTAVLFPLGIYLAITQEQPALAIAASLLWFGGALAFLVNLLRMLAFPVPATA
ncbi:MAG: hypothetical protein KDG89_03985 [Geminicoccaceae bacterium]|nr:hypothetical protein [Geminicoccaceae bacterium]